MKGIRIKVIFAMVLLLPMASSVCYGLDTDLYVVSNVNVPPNVIIIMDSSASMDEVTSGQNYDPTIDYSAYSPSTVYPRYAAYIKNGKVWVKWVDDYTTISCTDLRDNYLVPYGMANNYSNASDSCKITKKDFQTGNFMNYLQLTGGPEGSRPRFGLQNGILKSYINTTLGVRFAVMTFNKDSANNTVKWDGTNQLEYVFADPRDNPLDAVGGRLLGFVDENKIGKEPFFESLASFKNDSWSPLAETLYEAGVYLQGKRSAITGTNYTTPVQYYCQKTYILIISDGDPTKDSDPRLKELGVIDDLNSNGQIDLDEVSKYLYNLDLSNGKSTNKQNIKTYTIGFSITKKLLEDTARNSGGKYFYVWSSQSFDVAFQAFIADVLKESTSYVAPVVPISQMERTSAGNRMYLAMFKPTEKSFWKGNIKKFGLAIENSGLKDKDNPPTEDFPGPGDIDYNCNKMLDYEISVGDILDKNGNPAIDCLNKIKDSSQSYWSETADGEDVEKGGVGEKLLNRAEPRKIYTYLGNPNITDDTNAFVPGFTSPITPGMLGLPGGDTTGRDKVVNFIHGLDSYDWYGRCDGPTPEIPDGDTNAKRCWILGAFIHSRPVVVHYNASLSIIYAGANDGILHAFNDAELGADAGKEEWAFIPPSLLPRLKDLNGEALQFFVDGAPRVYIERDNDGNLTKGILIFGLRRGGDRYIALDITTYNQPKLLWEISSSTPGFGQLGQSWSTPNIAKIKYGGGEKWVAFISGGYHENQDFPNPVPDGDLKGKAIYVVDILNGNLLMSYSNTDNPAMKYCIPSDISRVDTNNDSYIDRLYVGDVGGQIWRFDIGASGLTGKVVFDANFGESLKRKIFYSPEVTLENGYDMLFFGTGDREHPKDITKIDRLYTIKDKNSGTPLKESELYDATEDLLQTGDSTQRSTEMNKLNGSEGWYIKLNQNLGEKCLSNTVIFYKVLYYSTFQPTFGEPGDPCFLGEGIARIYALNYKTGNAVFNLDGLGTLSELTRTDRSSLIGVSIPSGVIVTFVGGMTVAYGGVGGGVYRPPIPATRVLFPVNWKTVF